MSIAIKINTEVCLLPTPRFRCQSPARAGRSRTFQDVPGRVGVYSNASPAMLSPAKDAETVRSTMRPKKVYNWFNQ